MLRHPTVAGLAGQLVQSGVSDDRVLTTAPVIGPGATAFARRAIAVAGLACHLPRSVAAPLSLWTVLSSGVDCIGALSTPRLGALNDTQQRLARSFRGGFIDEVRRFEWVSWWGAGGVSSSVDLVSANVAEVVCRALIDGGYGEATPEDMGIVVAAELFEAIRFGEAILPRQIASLIKTEGPFHNTISAGCAAGCGSAPLVLES